MRYYLTLTLVTPGNQAVEHRYRFKTQRSRARFAQRARLAFRFLANDLTRLGVPNLAQGNLCWRDTDDSGNILAEYNQRLRSTPWTHRPRTPQLQVIQ